eukprot:COSAG01_NODE_608_length_14865_cov_5.517879_7_plen_119_part_00
MGTFVMRTLDHDISGAWGPQLSADLPDNPTAVVLENGTTLLIGRGFGNSNATGFVSVISLAIGDNYTVVLFFRASGQLASAVFSRKASGHCDTNHKTITVRVAEPHTILIHESAMIRH